MPVDFNKEYISTTVGRVILNDALPPGMPFVNGLLKKKGIGQLVNYCNQNLGLEVTVGMLDRIKSLGFNYATRSGLSVGLDDMVIPASKYTVVDEADKKVIEVQKQYMDGAITNGAAAIAPCAASGKPARPRIASASCALPSE